MKKLIEKATVLGYRKISGSINIDQYIYDAQEFDLKPLLSDVDYKALYSDTTKVFNGSDSEGGMDKALSLFVYARYVFFGGDVSTPFSVINKKFDDGEKVDRERLKELYVDERRMAFRIVSRYYNCTRSNLGFKLSKIS